MKKLLEFRLARRAVIDWAAGIIFLGVLLCFVLKCYLAKPSGNVSTTLLFIIASIVLTLPQTIKDLHTLLCKSVDHGFQASLKLEKGRVRESVQLPFAAEGRFLLFFESNRNRVEGRVILRRLKRSTPQIIRESVFSLNQELKKFSRGFNATPFQIVVDNFDCDEAFLDFEIRTGRLKNWKRPATEEILVLSTKPV